MDALALQLAMLISGGWTQHEDGTWTREGVVGATKVSDRWDGTFPMTIQRVVTPPAVAEHITLNLGIAAEVSK